MAERRTGQIHLRVSPAQFAAWRAKAHAAGLPLSDLLRQAMARTRNETIRTAALCPLEFPLLDRRKIPACQRTAAKAARLR